MGTYAAVGAAAVLVLALVLWIGGPKPPAAIVELPEDSPWPSAVLDDGTSLRTLSRGQPLTLPPGHYRVTLHGPDNSSDQRDLDLPAGHTSISP